MRDYMVFYLRREIDKFIRSLIYLGQGSQGVCYRDSKNVYKFYHSYFDDDYEGNYKKEEILQFKNVKSSTFIFPKEIIMLNDQVIGDITVYRNARNLYQINPLNVNLDKFLRLVFLALKDLEELSKKGILCYDVMYNILMGYRIYIIDTLEYCFSDIAYQEILRNNLRGFYLEIMYFLVDGLFLDVVKSCPRLNDMYESKNSVSIIDFIAEFRNYLKEILGKEIIYLREAKEIRDINVENLKYDRDVVVRERIINFKK